MNPKNTVLLTLCLAIFWASVPLEASKVRIARVHSQDDFLKGTLDGVNIDELGTVRLTATVQREVTLEQPMVFTGHQHPEGWVVGTGSSGRVLLITRSGETRELFAASEGEVFAITADAEGTVFVGTSPNGKVYRLRNGESEVYFDPDGLYIWGLAVGTEGELWVATGAPGHLYRVTDKDQGTVHWSGGDLHLRTLLPAPGGSVLVGTAGKGLVVKVDAKGRVQTLHDAGPPEVLKIVRHDNGDLYVAAVASEASPVILKEKKDDDKKKTENGEVAVEEGPQSFGSRPASYKGPRSELIAIPQGRPAETVAVFDEETIYDLRFRGERLWIATGQEGKVFSYSDHHLILENDVDAAQVVGLLGGEDYPVLLTTNIGSLQVLGTSGTREGSFESPVIDAGQLARFGTLEWRGNEGQGGTIEFSLRTGISAEPDETWTDWSDPQRGHVNFSATSEGRFFQWRASFSATGSGSPSLRSVGLSFRQLNQRPRIQSFQALSPGVILVPSNFTPGQQVYEPVHPGRDSIFTTLEEGSAQEVKSKKIWKHGMRTLQWKTKDPNEDKLSYILSFRVEGNSKWYTMVQDLEEDHWGFDASALPDGIYRFRLQASDHRDNLEGTNLTAERISEPVLVDHSAPELKSVKPRAQGWDLVVEDLVNPIREIELSIDGKEWIEVPTQDGLVDSQREEVWIDSGPKGSLRILRVMDAAFNHATYTLEP